MQPLEKAKDALSVLLFKTYAVVRNRDDPVLPLMLGSNDNLERDIIAPVFKSVREQILKNLGDLRLISY